MSLLPSWDKLKQAASFANQRTGSLLKEIFNPVSTVANTAPVQKVLAKDNAATRALDTVNNSPSSPIGQQGYFNQQVIQPVTQGAKALVTPGHRLQGSLDLLKGAYNVTPQGIAQNAAISSTASLGDALRTGKANPAAAFNSNRQLSQGFDVKGPKGMALDLITNISTTNPEGIVAGGANLQNLSKDASLLENIGTVTKSGSLALGFSHPTNTLQEDLKTVAAPAKGLVRGVTQYASNLAHQKSLDEVASKLYATVSDTTNKSLKTGQFAGTVDSGNVERVFTEKSFDEALRGKGGIRNSVDPGALMSNDPKVTVTLGPKGDIVSVRPERPEFGQYLEDASKLSPAGRPAGTESAYPRAVLADPSAEYSLEGAQFRSRPSGEKPSAPVPRNKAGALAPMPGGYNPEGFYRSRLTENGYSQAEADAILRHSTEGAGAGVAAGEGTYDSSSVMDAIHEQDYSTRRGGKDYKGKDFLGEAAGQEPAPLPAPVAVPGEKPFDAMAYVKEQTAAQDAARKGPGTGLRQKASNFLNDVKSKVVDSAAPIEDVLARAQKEGGYMVTPQNDISLKIDRSLRAGDLAGQFAKDNGIVDVIRNAPDLNALDQYLIAKQAASVAANGIETGRDAAKDARLVQALGPQYEPFAQTVKAYSDKVLSYATDTGLVSRENADLLREKYPDYVPLNRIFSEDEAALRKPANGSGTRSIASQGSQSVVQRLKGSTREVESPITSLLAKTNDAFQQGERNLAARQLIDYKDLPGNPFQLRELGASENATGKATVSAMVDGKKVSYETTPEIAESAKRLNRQQLGLLGNVLAVPVRVLKLGATGINLPFVATNLVKDQVTAFVNSDRAAATSLANPANFVRAFFSAAKKDGVYEDLVRNAGGGNSFDITRDKVPDTVAKIRSGRNIATKVAYTVTHPGELLRAAEDLIGVTENTTRVQQFTGMRGQLLKEGRNATDAALLAAKAARQNTTDFARGGDWSPVLNAVLPYFNAGIQGSRQLLRTLKSDPKGVALKLTVAVFSPIAAATLWNMSDPDRKAAYDDIPESDKENSIIIVPPHPTQNADGRWNVIRIPISQEVANLGSIVRRGVEAGNGGDPVGFGEVASNLFQAGTSVSPEPDKLISQFTPQLIKPEVEGYTNTNLYTGLKIVPDSLKDLPAGEQYKPTTSGFSKAAGKALGVSPLKLDNAISTSFGGVGTQLIRGQNPLSATVSRFTTANSGATESKQYDRIQAAKEQDALQNRGQKEHVQAAADLYRKVAPSQRPALLKKLVERGIVTQDTKAAFKDAVSSAPQPAKGSQTYLSSQSADVRANIIRQDLAKIPSGQRAAYVRDLASKGIVTRAVLQKILHPTN